MVTLSHHPRRREPYTLNGINFTVADLLMLAYSSSMLIASMHFHGTYHLHMDDWLNSNICPVIGFMLITGTTAASFFYNVSIIMIYLKVVHSMKIHKHLNKRKLLVATLICWGLSAYIASIPFWTRGSYSSVGQCMPFYADDHHTGFKYVVLYTVLKALCLVLNITLAVLTGKAFCRNRRNKAVPEDYVDPLTRENAAIARMIGCHMACHLTLSITIVLTLVMSCAGGSTGKRGREMFSHLCVLEAVFWPLIGPLRSANFYTDTLKVLRKWNCCYDWNTNTVCTIMLNQVPPEHRTSVRKDHQKNAVNPSVSEDSHKEVAQQASG